MKIVKVSGLNLNGRKVLDEREKDMLSTALYTITKRNAERFGMCVEMECHEFVDTTFCNDNIVANEEGVFVEEGNAVLSIDGLFLLPSFEGIFGIATDINTREQNIVRVEF